MNVVIDTNVIVSGLLNPHGKPAEVLRFMLTSNMNIHFDSRILSEYIEVLNCPEFMFNQEHVELFIIDIEMSGNLVLSTPLETSLPDPNDNMFLEVAIACNADCIITGNLSHYPVKLCKHIKILSPAEFIKNYNKRR